MLFKRSRGAIPAAEFSQMIHATPTLPLSILLGVVNPELSGNMNVVARYGSALPLSVSYEKKHTIVLSGNLGLMRCLDIVTPSLLLRLVMSEWPLPNEIL